MSARWRGATSRERLRAAQYRPVPEPEPDPVLESVAEPVAEAVLEPEDDSDVESAKASRWI